MVPNGKKTRFNLMKNPLKIIDKNRGKGHILEADVKYPKKLHELRSNLLFLP